MRERSCKPKELLSSTPKLSTLVNAATMEASTTTSRPYYL